MIISRNIPQIAQKANSFLTEQTCDCFNQQTAHSFSSEEFVAYTEKNPTVVLAGVNTKLNLFSNYMLCQKRVYPNHDPRDSHLMLKNFARFSQP